jgi:hypothetical protein
MPQKDVPAGSVTPAANDAPATDATARLVAPRAPQPMPPAAENKPSRPSIWTTGPAWVAAFFAFISAVVGALNYFQARQEKRLHVDPRVLWDVDAFVEGTDWHFAATNTGGVNVEGYDVELEVAAIPAPSAADQHVTLKSSSSRHVLRWGKRIDEGQSVPVTFLWTDDDRSVRDGCERTIHMACLLGIRVVEVFHRSQDFRRYHRARVFIPLNGMFRALDQVALTQESLAVQRYFATAPSDLLGRVPAVFGEEAHGD